MSSNADSPESSSATVEKSPTILARLARSLKARDWGAAVIEIAIVVIGIFIGLQVDAWNDVRKDRQEESDYLQRLHDDVATLVGMQQQRIETRMERLEDMADAADILIGVAPLTDWSKRHCDALAFSHIYVPLPMALPALDEMLSTGKLSLIRDIPLREALSRLQIQVVRSEEMIARIDGSVRVLSRHYPHAIWESIVPDDESENRRHDTQPACDLEVIRSNPVLLNDVADNYSRYHAYATSGLANTLEHFQQVHDLLDLQLGFSH